MSTASTPGTVKPIPQEQLLAQGVEPTPAPKIFTETCRIDWCWDGEKIYNRVRGLSPYPGAWTTLVDKNGKKLKLKIFETAEPSQSEKRKPGAMVIDKNRLLMACGDGAIEVLSLQLEGKRRMRADELLRGYDLSNYTIEN